MKRFFRRGLFYGDAVIIMNFYKEDEVDMRGYWQKILHVNLTTQSTRIEEIDEKTLKLLLGGAALGAKLLLEQVPPKDPPVRESNTSGGLMLSFTAFGE